MTSGARLTSTGLRLLGLALFCISPPSLAADWGLPQLMSGFAGVEESRARFQEEKHLAMLTEPLQLSGTLRYVRPSQIEKQVTQPYVESLRINQDRLEWTAQGRTRTLSLRSQPQIWALVESLRATLAGDLPALQRHYTVKLDGSRAKWKITLEPRYDDLSQFIQEIRLQGRDNLLRQVEIVEASGGRSLMRIEEMAN
ncbi:MAG: LolA-related protein [Gammaproteobacteria bacterium]